jgi:hypothetical protein
MAEKQAMVNFLIPKELHDKFKKICKENGIVMKHPLTEAIIEFVKRNSRR